MHFLKFGIFAAVFFCLSLFGNSAKAEPTLNGVDGLRHAGAVYFYAQPGTLIVTLWKRDLSGNPNERASTAVLMEGTPQAKALRAGVYTLLLSANSDQYLSLQTIGFSTNAAQHMVSSGAGHTETARPGPIILDGPDKPFGIFFKPSQGAFKVQLSGLPKNAKSIAMYDAAGKLVRAFESLSS